MTGCCEGKLAVVTGAARGLGRAIAVRLAREGAAVALVDVEDMDGAVQIAGLKARAFRCDLSDLAALKDAAKAIEAWGGPCGVLVNNAGVFPHTPLERLDAALWRRVMAVNLDAPFLLSRAFAPGMRVVGWGRIVNIASAVIADTRPDVAAYMASKMGLIGMTRALANDLGPHGITVNAVSPGLVPTEGVTGKFGADAPIFAAIVKRQAVPQAVAPEDIADMVAYLASPGAAKVSGQTLIVDGGLSRS